jgi:hypothetical protein
MNRTPIGIIHVFILFSFLAIVDFPIVIDALMAQR